MQANSRGMSRPDSHPAASKIWTHHDSPKSEPRPGCLKCQRLVTYRRANKKLYPGYFNAATGSFGDAKSTIAIVGLAPGLHGANKTGRVFTGDASGTLLFDCLEKTGFTEGVFKNKADDGLKLKNLIITNAVRCAPPDNKPTNQEQINCRSYLVQFLKKHTHIKVIIALGKIAHDAILKAMGQKLHAHPFHHGAIHHVGAPLPILIDSYHCSRYNQNTGRITAEMLCEILLSAQNQALKAQ